MWIKNLKVYSFGFILLGLLFVLFIFLDLPLERQLDKLPNCRHFHIKVNCCRKRLRNSTVRLRQEEKQLLKVSWKNLYWDKHFLILIYLPIVYSGEVLNCLLIPQLTKYFPFSISFLYIYIYIYIHTHTLC